MVRVIRENVSDLLGFYYHALIRIDALLRVKLKLGLTQTIFSYLRFPTRVKYKVNYNVNFE